MKYVKKFEMINEAININLEFKYNGKVYYINCNKRIVKTEQYNGLFVKIPVNIKIPDMSDLQYFNGNINQLESSLEVDNENFRELQIFIKNIDWEKIKIENDLNSNIENYIDDYGIKEFKKLIEKYIK